MRILGAKVLVEDGDDVKYSDLIKVSLEGTDCYFQKDLGTKQFNLIYSANNRDDAEARLRDSGAKTYREDKEAEKGFVELMKDMDGEAIRFQLEGFLETLTDEGKLGEE